MVGDASPSAAPSEMGRPLDCGPPPAARERSMLPSELKAGDGPARRRLPFGILSPNVPAARRPAALAASQTPGALPAAGEPLTKAAATRASAHEDGAKGARDGRALPPPIGWSVLKTFAISTDDRIASLKGHAPAGKRARASSVEAPRAALQAFDDLHEGLAFYRFPFFPITSETHGRLAKMLSPSLGGGRATAAAARLSPEGAIYKGLVESWRKALLSLYQSWRLGDVDYFYYIQADLVVLFSSSPTSAAAAAAAAAGGDGVVREAHIARASQTLMATFKEEGIQFSAHSDEKLYSHRGLDGSGPDDDEAISDQEEEEEEAGIESGGEEDAIDENCDPRLIRRNIDRRVNRARRPNVRSASTATVRLSIGGQANVHTLIDYIINQKNGKSFVILPELVAPRPFLFATQFKSDVAVVGPLNDGTFQARLLGDLILPSAAALLQRTVLAAHASASKEASHPAVFKQVAIPDERTDAFAALPYRL